MNTATFSRLRLSLVSLCIGTSGLHGQVIANPGFELGTAPSRNANGGTGLEGIAVSGATYVQAVGRGTFGTGSYTDPSTPTNRYDDTFSQTSSGGASQAWTVGTPSGWTLATSGNDGRPEQWIYTRNSGGTPTSGLTTGAKAGSGFAYISTINNIPSGLDDCLQNSITSLTLNNWYTISFWAADAGSYLATSTINATEIGVPVEPGTMANRTRVDGTLVFELDTGGSTFNQAYGGGPTPPPIENGVWAYKTTLPSNAAWSDRSLSVIPWQQVNYTFKATATTMSFWMSGNNDTTNRVSSVVLDAISIVNIGPTTPVPESSTYGLLGVGSLIAMVALRRNSHRKSRLA